MKTYSKETKAKIAEYIAAGFNIIEGNNTRLYKAAKYRGREVIRICQTNASRANGGRSYTVWAVK